MEAEAVTPKDTGIAKAANYQCKDWENDTENEFVARHTY